jgi:hypothetical protein
MLTKASAPVDLLKDGQASAAHQLYVPAVAVLAERHHALDRVGGFERGVKERPDRERAGTVRREMSGRRRRREVERVREAARKRTLSAPSG